MSDRSEVEQRLHDVVRHAVAEMFSTDITLVTELRRWSPEEVVELRLLPYGSVRGLKAKCHAREIHHHNDGGRITFTTDDIRAENARHQVTPERP